MAAEPHLVLGDEMIERACAVLEHAGYEDVGDMDRGAVRAALEAAFDGVPMVNYGIGLCLQFFDLVICLKAGAGAGVYRAAGPDGFDALNHHLNLTYAKSGELSSVQVSKLATLNQHSEPGPNDAPSPGASPPLEQEAAS